MPIYSIEILNNDCIWGVWKNGEEDSFEISASTDLSSVNSLAAITHANKKIERLSSRALVKCLMEKINQPFYGIVSQDNCRPYLINHHFYLSISHTNEFSAAIIHKSANVGIDIEMVREKLRTVAPKFLSYTELIEAGDDLNKLCVCWGVKEVIYKIYSLRNISLKNNIFIHPFTFVEKSGICEATLRINDTEMLYSIHYQKIDNYYLTFNVSAPPR